jgi:RNA polymerase sigma-70 factor (ECF subfamily)
MAKPKDDSYPTRPSLLQRLKSTEDHQSWQEFHDRYRRLIFGFALKAGLTEDEAEEVVQETMIAAAKNLPEFRYDPAVCSFKTWLLNLSRWRVQDQIRKRQSPSAPSRLQRPPEDTVRTATVDRVPDPSATPLEALWEKEWQASLLDAAIARVKERMDSKRWQMFDLYALKGWSVTDVAKALGVSVGRVYLTKHRVSAQLKKELKRLEAQSAADAPWHPRPDRRRQ